MERIKQALELARQEREKNAGQMPKRAIPKKDRGSIADQEIKYTETRSIQLPTRELREKRIIVDQQNVISDAYRLLRTQILQRLNENRCAVCRLRVHVRASVDELIYQVELAFFYERHEHRPAVGIIRRIGICARRDQYFHDF